MKIDELRKMQGTPPRTLKHEEHNAQVVCVRWFRLTFPQFASALFAVPNGAMLNGTYQQRLKAGKRLREEGMLKGVADLILLVPSGGYHGMCIEMKSAKGALSHEQKLWGEYITQLGYKYVVVKPPRGTHPLYTFMQEVRAYFLKKNYKIAW